MKTTHKQIYEYWSNLIDESKLNIDWCDGLERCWNCGNKRKLERCHIIPKSIGGIDINRNYVLLCNDCHTEAPNVNNNYYIWEWIYSNKSKLSLYGTYEINKAFDLFKANYGIYFNSLINKKNIKDFLNYAGDIKFTNHFGKGINKSTWYYILENYYKRLCLKNVNKIAK